MSRCRKVCETDLLDLWSEPAVLLIVVNTSLVFLTFEWPVASESDLWSCLRSIAEELLEIDLETDQMRHVAGSPVSDSR